LIGAWDYPTNRAAYRGCTITMPKVLDVMQRRHRAVIEDTPNAAIRVE
jgi:hypothetical protein